jgi:hypothetical protein
VKDLIFSLKVLLSNYSMEKEFSHLDLDKRVMQCDISKVLEFLMAVTKISLLHNQTIHQNAYKQDPLAKEFGLSIADKPASVDARVLPAPWVNSRFLSAFDPQLYC